MRFVTLSLALTLASAAMPAAAQDTASGFNMSESAEANSRNGLSRSPEKQKQQFEFARVFGKCAYGLNPDRARLALDQSVEGKAARRLEFPNYVERVDSCSPVRSLLDADLMRAGLAEASILDPENERTIPQGGDVEKVGTFLKAVTVPKVDKSDPFVMHQLAAQCRVAMAPYPARALLDTEPGSGDEAAALQGWKSVTQGCDSLLQDVTPLSPYFERAYAALALYYWIDFAGEA